MYEASRVRVREPGGELTGDLAGFAAGVWLARDQPVLERAAAEILEHHVRPASRLSVVVEAADVRVSEGRHGMRLAFEAGGVGIAAEDLQGNPPAELDILRGPNLGHPTNPEAVVESVATPYQFIRHGASLCGLRG